jgi:hypothetical protein
MKRVTWLLAIAALLLAGGCKEGKKGNNLLPNPLGKAGEVMVVLDVKGGDVDTLWNTLKSTLSEEFPYLPQPQPKFDIIKLPPQNFNSVRAYRNIIFINIDAKTYPESKILLRYDVWASPQLVMTLVGPTPLVLANYIKKEKDRFVGILEQAERDRQMKLDARYPDQRLELLVQQKFNISLTIPNGYKLNRKTDDFVWMSRETPFTSQGIFVYSYPYTSDSTFTAKYLIGKRDFFTKKYVPGPSNGSYMITGHFYEPQMTPLMFKGRYFAMLRGLWEVQNDFMGGPFVSLTSLDQKRNRVITVGGYVYAPKDEKRNMIRQLEAILFSLTDSSAAKK